MDPDPHLDPDPGSPVGPGPGPRAPDLDPDPDLDLDLDFGPWILDPGFVRLSSFLKKPVPSDSQFLKVKFLKVLVWCRKAGIGDFVFALLSHRFLISRVWTTDSPFPTIGA